MRKLAVLTSGGDAAGMNAAVRAVTRTAIAAGIEVFGVRHGYAGLIADDLTRLKARAVGNILHIGGTFLGSARCPEFAEEPVRARALELLRARGIEGLVVIGGNGSQTGSQALSEMGFPVVGIASTIDNDLAGTDVALGVDTALNVAMEAVDKLRVTASSHRRASVIEIMGRDCGYLALRVGIATGAETIVIPEVDTQLDEVVASIRDAHTRGKPHALIVVAEGARLRTELLVARLQSRSTELGYDLRATVLGHIQRGGTPTCADRLLGTRFGAAATRCLLSGEHGVLVGELGGRVSTTPLAEIAGKQKPLDLELLRLAPVLAN